MTDQDEIVIPAVFSIARDAKNVIHTKFEIDKTHQGVEIIGLEKLYELLWFHLALKEQEQFQPSDMTEIPIDEHLLSQGIENQLAISLMVAHHEQVNIKLSLLIPTHLSPIDTHTFIQLACISRRNTPEQQTEILLMKQRVN